MWAYTCAFASADTPARSHAEQQGSPIALAPLWTYAAEAGIEWCQPVGSGANHSLLVCTKDARVDLLDVRTGQSSLTTAVSVERGVRFAGMSDGVAYCHGPSRIYAFGTAPEGRVRGAQQRLLWDVPVAPTAQTEGDPEFLTRIVAGSATPGGVMVVRSDGRVAELARDDGTLCWETRVAPPVGVCTLHVRGAAAVLVWKQGGGLRVCFFGLRNGRPGISLMTVEEPPPLWTRLVDEGLIAVWPRRFGLISKGQPPRIRPYPDGLSASTATLALQAPAVTAGSHDGRSPATQTSQLFLRASARLYACDVASWQWRSFELLPLEHLEVQSYADTSANAVAPRRFVWLSDDNLFVIGSGGVAVRDSATGEVSCTMALSGAIDAGVREEFVYGLSAAATCEASNRRAKLMLRRRRISANTSVRASEHDPPAWQDFELGQARDFRTCYWCGGILIVEDDCLRAFDLP